MKRKEKKISFLLKIGKSIFLKPRNWNVELEDRIGINCKFREILDPSHNFCSFLNIKFWKFDRKAVKGGACECNQTHSIGDSREPVFSKLSIENQVK